MIDYRWLQMEQPLWEDFCRELRREYRKVRSGQTGVLVLKYKNSHINKIQLHILVSSCLSEFLDDRQIRSEWTLGEGQQCLPIDLQPELTTYLFYSTRLAILQAFPEWKEWLLKSFADVRMYYRAGQMNFFFLEERLEEALEFWRMSYQEVPQDRDIVQYTRENIQAGRYVNIHLDEFYIQGKESFERLHYVHESLIYGYNDSQGVFYAYGFSKRNQMRAFEISYQEYNMAFEKGKLFYFCGAGYLQGEYPWPVVLCRPRAGDNEPYRIEDFHTSLNHFRRPPPSETVDGDLHIYGMDVYSYIIQQIQSGDIEEVVDYRTFHLLYEHKKCIAARLQYWREKKSDFCSLDFCIKEWEEVVRGFNRIRLLYMKQLMMEGGAARIWNQAVQDWKFLDFLAEQIVLWRDQEEQVLDAVIQVLENELEEGFH